MCNVCNANIVHSYCLLTSLINIYLNSRHPWYTNIRTLFVRLSKLRFFNLLRVRARPEEEARLVNKIRPGKGDTNNKCVINNIWHVHTHTCTNVRLLYMYTYTYFFIKLYKLLPLPNQYTMCNMMNTHSFDWSSKYNEWNIILLPRVCVILLMKYNFRAPLCTNKSKCNYTLKRGVWVLYLRKHVKMKETQETMLCTFCFRIIFCKFVIIYKHMSNEKNCSFLGLNLKRY